MNTPTISVLGRRIALPALSLLALGLLFLASALFQQPAYSQSLTSPGAPDAVAPEATPVRTPCPTPVHPPGDKVRLYGDDEILLSYRQANDPRFLNHTVLDNPVGGTALVQTESVWYSNLPNLDEVGWLANTAADLNGDYKAEIVSAFRNHSSALGALSDTALTSTEQDWYNNSSSYAGSTVSWIDAAAGDLDRGHDNDEVVVAFKDNNSDIHVVVLDGSPKRTDGTIANGLNNQSSAWTVSDAERGSVNHVSVTTGDLNGDGSNDEIVVAFKDSGSDLQVEILRHQNDTATLKEIWHLDSRDNGRDNTASAGSGPWANKWPIDVTTGDLDGDMKDEVVVAFRIGDAKSGDIQILVLDETSEAADQMLTVDSSVWKNHNVSDKYHEAATAVSVSAADLDGDGLDEIALAYNGVYDDLCSSMGGSYVCNTRWIQTLVTYDYVPFAAPEFSSWCSGATSTIGCLHQRSGTWNSGANYGYDRGVEANVVVATGDLDRDNKAEIALAHYNFDTDDVEVITFDADSGLTRRTSWSTNLGSNYPWEFFVSMGDRDGDSRYATYTDSCYVRTDAQVASVIYAPPHWPAGHPAANYEDTGASFDATTLQAAGQSTEVSTKIGSKVTVGPSIEGIGASFTYGWEKEASAGKTTTKSTESGLKYSTCPPALNSCKASPNWTGVQIVETTFNCFVYNEPAAGNMDVCLPTYTRSLPYSQNWWYTEGYRLYPESWIPLGHNLAQGRSASQSSTDAGWPAEPGRAVDGNVNGIYTNGSVAHTAYHGKPPGTAWWEVDLGGVDWIGAVQVWNRTDAGYTNRLKDFYVFVSEEPFSTSNADTLRNTSSIWKQYVSGEAGRPTIIPVDARGRYVRVQLFGPDAAPCNTRGPSPCSPTITSTAQNYLDMAELQVYGMPGAVDQWPKAQPVSAGTNQLTLTWPDARTTGGQIVQTVDGQLVGVDSGKTSLAASVQSQESTLGFGHANETINASSTSQEMSLGMEIVWLSAEATAGSSQKTSYILSWGKNVGFYGDVLGLPAETTPPTICPYQYDFSQYAWLQRSTSKGGVNHAFLVGGYWVPHMGPPPGQSCATGAALAAAPAIKPATPIIQSPTHPDPAAWTSSSTATFDWAQPPDDPATIAGYNWTLDQSADTVPLEFNHGLTTTKTYEKLADGVWYMHVAAVSAPSGAGGQWSDPAHRAIRVDANPPKVELALDPAQPTGNNGWYVTPLTVTVSADDGNGSGVSAPAGGIEVSTDGATWQPYAAPLTFDQDTPGVTLYARATDAIGQVSEPVTATFKIDRTPPDSHVAGGDGPGAWIAGVFTNSLGNEVLALAGSIAEGGSGRSGMSLEYDDLDWTGATAVGAWPLPTQPAIEANWYFTVTHEIGAGNHIFLGRAQDLAGNQEAPYEIARVLWYPQDAPDIAGSSVTASPSAIRPGEVVTFTLVARNAGWQEAHVSVVDTLPAGLTPVIETLAADGAYDEAAGTLTWPARLLWPGEWVERTFEARAGADLPATVLENRATFHAGWPNTDLLPAAERQRFLDRERTAVVTARVAVDPGLPAGADHTAPWVILARAPHGPVTSPQVELGIPAAAGAARMYLREWTPDRMTGAWTVAQSSGWLDYARTLTWTLSEGQGVKYLGVWVADAAGNVSTLDEHSLISINRMDGSQSLADGERVQYRGYAEEGMKLMLGLKTVAGDPDLYAWRPRNAFRPDRYTQATVLPGQVEESGYQVVQQTGRVLLEVQAVGPSEYELIAAQAVEEQAAAAGAAEAKPVPQHPLTVSDPLSARQVGPGVILETRSYLPLILR